MTGRGTGLIVSGLRKSYGGAVALDGMDLCIAPGEVHALLGQNGCGKSTLVKCLTGVESPDGGQLRWNGRQLPNPVVDAHRYGIAVIHQDIGLVDAMTVLENLAIGARFGTRLLAGINWKRERSIYLKVMDRLKFSCDLDAPVSTLSPAERALLGVARAMRLMGGDGSDQLFILDEPTASLPQSEARRVMNLMRSVAESGAAVIFISHRLVEVMEVCDRVTVMRNGQSVATGAVGEMTRESIVAAMLGRRMDDFYPTPPRLMDSATRLAVDGLCGGKVTDLSFQVRSGEIVGVTGLAGMGQEELPLLLAGAQKPRSGKISLDSSAVSFRSPSAAIKAGVALVPGNRLRDGVWAEGTAAENITLPVLGRHSGWHGLKKRKLALRAEELMSQVSVHPHNPALPVSGFSGGNQQKIVFGKWLQLRPGLLLLDEPTQGVDPGAAKELLTQAMDLASNGTAVLVCSSDHEQIAAICHRVIVLNQGRKVAELSAPDLSEEALLAASEAPVPALVPA
ncbi:sugar ABC transporter ATP-binding protein [Arthrobacter sp. NPDC055585]